MNKTILFQGNPGNGGGLPACYTPNPPWWRGDGGEVTPAPIDQLLIAFLIIGTILGIWYIWNKKSDGE